MKDTAMSMDLYNRLYWFFHIWLSAKSLMTKKELQLMLSKR